MAEPDKIPYKRVTILFRAEQLAKIELKARSDSLKVGPWIKSVVARALVATPTPK